MLDAELDAHLDNEKTKKRRKLDNGNKKKILFGESKNKVPRDREGRTFIVPKRHNVLSMVWRILSYPFMKGILTILRSKFVRCMILKYLLPPFPELPKQKKLETDH